MNCKIALCILLLASSIPAFSQNNKANSFEYFGPYKVFVNGNTFLKPRKQKNYLNPRLKNEDAVLYNIDEDREKKTYSSTSVSVNIPKNATIEKALVIWACNYNICFIDEAKDKRLDKIPSTDMDDGTIKFKGPFHQDYLTLRPNVILDNSKYDTKTESDIFDPSIFSIDITEMLQKQNKVNGTYWLANFNTIQGQNKDGLSAGWSILIIYKQPNIEDNFISGSIGLTEINQETETAIVFPNAKSSMDIEYKSDIPFSLSMFTLGGDPNENEENIFWAKSTYKNTPINFENRDNTDLLSSSIDNFGGRQPRLKNNFGVDLFTVKSSIPTLMLKKDNDTDMTLGIESLNNTEKMQIIYSVLEIPSAKKLDPEQDYNMDFAGNTQLPLAQETAKKEEKKIEDEIDIRTYNIPNLESGYYIVNGVFGVKSNRINWIKHLNTISDYTLNYFNNPENKFDYIFLKYTKDLEVAKSLYYEARKLKDFEDTWILEVSAATKQVSAQNNYNSSIASKPSLPLNQSVTKKKRTENNITIRSSSSSDIDIRSYSIPSIVEGYYVVNGVFAYKSNRINWIIHLNNNSSYSVSYFNNPANNYDYIYLYHTKDLSFAKKKYFEARQKKDFEDTWILEVVN
ncbi:hypothetical protein [Seonamhaeicola marinus]|uniref:SPOR domain-containing protein n=1 Tax=Seonamhaeicola marinus TaxID=1912246 RepID=A0A5D0HJC9_9FLAO|nr:hypothetical protein [Seonamhaeicola marinus]TYA70167.1 hypothetical protein FUA24_23070 [Seonamhaeicola marinus]